MLSLEGAQTLLANAHSSDHVDRATVILSETCRRAETAIQDELDDTASIQPSSDKAARRWSALQPVAWKRPVRGHRRRSAEPADRMAPRYEWMLCSRTQWTRAVRTAVKWLV